MDDLFTPDQLATHPNVEPVEAGVYDWHLQRTAEPALAAQKQTFNGIGQPNDQTYGSGQTNQTFSGTGQPIDATFDTA